MIFNHPCNKALTRLENEGFEVLDRKKFLLRCPGDDLHTCKNQTTDCKLIYGPSGVYLKCYHVSCRPIIEEVNDWLDGSSAMARHPTRHPSVGSPQVPYRSLSNQVRIAQIVASHPWTYNDIVASSPIKIEEIQVKEHFIALLALFDPKDNIWIGRDVQDTGKPSHIRRFRTVNDWWDCNNCPGAYICPNSFNPGVFSRSTANVNDKLFLVVESDKLDHNKIGSVFKWMIAEGFHLRAVVDTAGKSLHGWFDYPPIDKIPTLKCDLTELDCDPSMFTPSQPCRLPGALRNGKYQKLIYLDLNLEK